MAGVKGKSGRKPGTPKTGGRKKGTPNKFSSDIKQMIINALNTKGGEDYLVKHADMNATAFLTLVGKVLPLTVAGDKDNPVETVVRIQWGE
jgi:hypothetical protein